MSNPELCDQATAPVRPRDLAIGGQTADVPLTLRVEVAGDGPPLLLLHGFTGSAATWRPLLPALDRWRTVAVDLLGHGHSAAPTDPRRYTMEHCTADLLQVLDHLGIERAAVLGYSMGGRVALHLALSAPHRVSALILEGASAGLEEARARRERRASDETLAATIERDGVAAFVEQWERLPLFATQGRLPFTVRADLRRQRLANRAVGLAGSLRGLGTGSQSPLWDRLATLSMPTLLVAGAEDATYAAIARRMAALVPGACLAIVPGAGHAVHLEQPAAFLARTIAFLTLHQPAADRVAVSAAPPPERIVLS